MSFGRKAKAPSPIAINAPPVINEVEFRSPTGDLFSTRTEGNKQINETFLSPTSQKILTQSQEGVANLLGELSQTSIERQKAIEDRSSEFFNQLSDGINVDADDILKRTQSDLSKRFGGTFRSTFGNDLIARLEENRQNNLSDARVEANLLGEDLINQDQNRALQRINLLGGLLDNSTGAAQRFGSLGSSTLSQERNRGNNLAVARANALQRSLNANRQASTAQRLGLLSTVGNLTNHFIRRIF